MEDFTDIQGEGVVSLAGRLKSFPEHWTGTPVMTLAQAGMYYKEGMFSSRVHIFSVKRLLEREISRSTNTKMNYMHVDFSVNIKGITNCKKKKKAINKNSAEYIEC